MWHVSAWDTGDMSMTGPNVQSPRDIGETIASYDDYEAAQKAVGRLIDAEIPAREISIVWANLRLVETVTGRLGYGRAAWSGALNGAMLGLLFGAVYTLLSPEASLQLLVGFMLVGTALGMLMQLLSYRLVRRRRDYSSATRPVADHYDVAVQTGHAARARDVLGEGRRAPTQVVRPSGPLPPPQYGVRVDPATNRPVPPSDAASGPPASVPPAPAAPPQFGVRIDPATGRPSGEAPAPADPPAQSAAERPSAPEGASPVDGADPAQADGDAALEQATPNQDAPNQDDQDKDDPNQDGQGQPEDDAPAEGEETASSTQPDAASEDDSSSQDRA